MSLSEALPSLAGGMLIGLAATLLLWGNGRVAGNSGILARCWPNREGGCWRLNYLAGLVLGGVLYRALSPGDGMTLPPSLPWLLVAGLLVGFGTQLGSGYTSGHGICGLARLSVRSLVATATFMLFAVVTVFAVRHLQGAWW